METAVALETGAPVDRQQPQPQAAPLPPPLRKRPLLAGFLAFFPGIGNIYNGLYLRGAVFFTLVASLLALANEGRGDHPVLGFAVAFVWLFNIIDSVRQAQLINHGYAQDLGMEDLPRLPKSGQGGLLAGILFLVLGILTSLQVFFHVDLSWVADFWPLGLIALGGGLIAAWYRQRPKAGDEA